MLTLYHTTNAAEVILTSGFRNGVGSYGLATLELRGVFLADCPVDCNEGAIGDQVLAVVLPDDVDLSDYELVDELKTYREWCVPAELINRHGQLRLLSEDDVDAACRDWRAARGR